MEKTSRIPTAPGVDSTTRSNSSSLPTIFTVTRNSFSFAIAVLGSPLGSLKSFCTATRISGDSGFLITRVKLFPSGQAFWMPLQSLMRSASGTSESLLPVDMTTAKFLIAATVEPPGIEAIHKRAVIRSHFPRALCFITPTLTFRQVTNSMFNRRCAEQVPVFGPVPNCAPPLLYRQSVNSFFIITHTCTKGQYPRARTPRYVLNQGSVCSFRKRRLSRMKRFAARYYFLILPLLFATGALAQAPASHVAEAANRPARKTPPVASAGQHLFGALPISTESREARKFIELAWDKYENSMYD